MNVVVGEILAVHGELSVVLRKAIKGLRRVFIVTRIKYIAV
jgi:hypothetical protein